MSDDELDVWTAVQWSMTITDHDDEPEAWQVRVVEVDEDGPSEDPEKVLADATLYRVHFDRDPWMDFLDSVDSDLAEVGATFLDRAAIAEVDEESLFATALVVVDYVEVRESARGRKLSHQIVRSAARVFEMDVIALMPSRASIDDDGELVQDQVKERRLQRHWGELGFVQVPGSNVMLWPIGQRE